MTETSLKIKTSGEVQLTTEADLTVMTFSFEFSQRKIL